MQNYLNSQQTRAAVERLTQQQGALPKGSFPLFFDSVLRAQFVECPQKFYWSTIQHLAPISKSEHLHFGGAFAKALEVARLAFYAKHCTPQEAELAGFAAMLEFWGDYEPKFTSPSTGVKTLDACVNAYQHYLEVWPLDKDEVQPYRFADGSYGIECTFAIPIPEVLHPETGDPMLYVGRWDLLGFVNNALWVTDEKTSTQLGAQWNRRWELRGQFTGYCWAARHYGFPVAGALIRGLGIYKQRIDHAQAFAFRDDWLVDRWYFQLVRDMKRAIAMYKEGIWDVAYDEACVAFGGCPYLELCNKEHPENWINGNYEEHHWNPLKQESQP